MSDELYIWISRWEDFQHYKPERDRGPVWIKQHVAQLLDERYLGLTLVQRAILHDLRLLFSAYRGRLSSDSRALSKKIGHKVTSAQLQALNHAGLVEFISREVLDERLEKFYTSPRARVRSREVELEVEEEEEVPNPPDGGNLECQKCGGSIRPRQVCPTCGANPRVAGTNPRALAQRSSSLHRAEAFTRNAGCQYEPPGFAEEIDRFDLTGEERLQVEYLYAELRGDLEAANGSEPEPAVDVSGNGALPVLAEELPWEGDAPPAVG